MGRTVLAAGGEVLHEVWHRSWQPADVVRAARRELKARHGRLAADLIAAEHRTHPTALDERWAAQLAAVSTQVWWGDDDAYLTGTAVREKCEPIALGRALMELLDLLSGGLLGVRFQGDRSDAAPSRGRPGRENTCRIPTWDDRQHFTTERPQPSVETYPSDDTANKTISTCAA